MSPRGARNVRGARDWRGVRSLTFSLGSIPIFDQYSALPYAWATAPPPPARRGRAERVPGGGGGGSLLSGSANPSGTSFWLLQPGEPSGHQQWVHSYHNFTRVGCVDSALRIADPGRKQDCGLGWGAPDQTPGSRASAHAARCGGGDARPEGRRGDRTRGSPRPLRRGGSRWSRRPWA